MSDSETIYTSSDYSSDSDSEGSMDGFIAPESTPEKCITSRAEISRSNMIEGPRKRQRVEEEEEEDSDSSSDYCPSE